MTSEDRNEIKTVLDAAAHSINVTIEAAESRAAERARDLQTEILRGIEAFARGNFARMHRIETSDATN